MAPRKRKFSELSVEQNSRVKQILLSCLEECDQLGIDEDDENVKELNRIINKLTDTKHTPFSDVSLLTFGKMGIKIQPMEWRSDGETDAKTTGNDVTLPGVRVDAPVPAAVPARFRNKKKCDSLTSLIRTCKSEEPEVCRPATALLVESWRVLVLLASLFHGPIKE